MTMLPKSSQSASGDVGIFSVRILPFFGWRGTGSFFSFATQMQLFSLVALIFTSSNVRESSTQGIPNPKNIIIDTDFLSFPDDVGALALANAFHNNGQARILGIVSTVNSRYSVPAMNAINTWYCNPSIPFAQNRTLTNETAGPNVDPTNNPVFVTTLANTTHFPQDIPDGSNEAISAPLTFYYDVLSRAANKSVTIVAIGLMNNLNELYRSRGGKELIEAKVAELVVEGGDFGGPGPNRAGYNLANNITAAKVLEDWPTPVTFLGGEIGRTVMTGQVLEKTPSENPVRVAYEIYHKGQNITNGSWDLLAMYYAVLGLSEGSFCWGNDKESEFNCWRSEVSFFGNLGRDFLRWRNPTHAGGGKIQIFQENLTAGWDYSTKVDEGREQHFLSFKESPQKIARKVDALLEVREKPQCWNRF